MTIRTEDIHSLSEFRQNAKSHLERIAKTKRPEILTVNGEAKGVIMSPKTYDKLIEDAEYAQNIKAIKRGLEAAKQNQSISAEEVFDEVRQVLNLDQ